MSNKAREEEFEPVLVVGMFRDNPAVRTLDYDHSLRATQIAGFMTAILDCMVDMVDEKDQIEFEDNILEAFEIFIKDRHEHTNKYQMGDED
jgi:hypothetical protein